MADDDCGFDPHVDFSMFLEEARHYTSTRDANQVSREDVYTEDRKKSKRSWQTYLFSWWRGERKKKMVAGDTGKVRHYVSIPRRGHKSGPTYGSHTDVEAKLQRQTSGPPATILNLNNAWKRSEDGIPYLCLEHVNSHHLRSYGTVYSVT